MNILVISPIYPSEDQIKQATPVVHYFAKEWVKLGHRVKVYNLPSNFPKWLYAVAKPFIRKISSLVGFPIRNFSFDNRDYLIEGVQVHRIAMHKIIPHSRYSDNEIKRVVKVIEEDDFIPDIIIGHWENPSLEIISKLKSVFDARTALVLHGTGSTLPKIYKKDLDTYIQNIDILGFRSWPHRRVFEANYSFEKPKFMALSGIPKSSFPKGGILNRDFSCIRRFLFVGQLIKRKFPTKIIDALLRSYRDESFQLTYVGQGAEKKNILSQLKRLKEGQTVSIIEALPRNEVFQRMAESDVFIMISKNEIYGLVYLEMMAAGGIVIASKNEGFDGIIRHGINGFLCEAGNEIELTQIIDNIRSMSEDELKKISIAAQQTARTMSDRDCAYRYLQAITENN